MTHNIGGMTPRTARTLLRILHLLLGAALAMMVYAPATWTDPLRLVLGTVVVPIVVLTGLAMWQQARLRRLLARATGRGRAPRDPA